jgi:hypothetical protein
MKNTPIGGKNLMNSARKKASRHAKNVGAKEDSGTKPPCLMDFVGDVNFQIRSREVIEWGLSTK